MSKCLFSRSSHVAYQINGNGAWSTMQAHNYSVFTYTLDPSGGVTVKIHVLKVVMLHFKLKEWKIEHTASTYFVLTHTLNLWVRLECIRKSECGHAAYQIKGSEVYTNIEAKPFTLHTT